MITFIIINIIIIIDIICNYCYYYHYHDHIIVVVIVIIIMILIIITVTIIVISIYVSVTYQSRTANGMDLYSQCSGEHLVFCSFVSPLLPVVASGIATPRAPLWMEQLVRAFALRCIVESAADSLIM